MAAKKRQIAGVASLALVAVYSVIMMATDGAASWAWLILAGAVAALVVAVRSEQQNQG